MATFLDLYRVVQKKTVQSLMHHQWRRNEFESGGGTGPAQSAGKIFLQCSLTFQ